MWDLFNTVLNKRNVSAVNIFVVPCVIVSIRYICWAHVDPGEPNEIRMSLVRYSYVVKFMYDLVSVVRESNPSGGENLRTRPYRPCGPVSLLYNGYRVIPGGKATGSWR